MSGTILYGLSIYQPKHSFALHFLFLYGKRSATARACPQILYYLGLVIVFIDEYNPSKISKMASNSVQVTDVSFKFATQEVPWEHFKKN